MSDEKATLIQYRLSQARESLKEADVLLREGMSRRSVMNRLYYAVFYALLGLLQRSCIEPLNFVRKPITWNRRKSQNRISTRSNHRH
jgi:hypothetical protein